MVISGIKISEAQLTQTLGTVSSSFKPQTAKAGGHTYVTLDPKTGHLGVSSNRGERLSFKELTGLVKEALQNDKMNYKDKEMLVKSFANITHQFENKKQGFFARLFGGSEKAAQLKEAAAVLQTGGELYISNSPETKRAAMTAKNDFLNDLVQKKLITADEAKQTTTFEGCAALYRKLSLKYHPDKIKSDDQIKSLNSSYEKFGKELEQGVGQKIALNKDVLGKFDKAFGG